MSTIELRRKIKKQIDSLAPDRLKSAAKFLNSLEQHQLKIEDNEKLERFRARLAKAERDIAAGRVIPVEKLKRKY